MAIGAHTNRHNNKSMNEQQRTKNKETFTYCTFKFLSLFFQNLTPGLAASFVRSYFAVGLFVCFFLVFVFVFVFFVM